MTADPALAARTRRALRPRAGRRVPGHQRVQAEILLRLKPDGAGLTVVGDDAQSIYSFRAASIENILEFPGAVHAARARRHARGKLPLDATGARRRQRADGRGRRGSTASTCTACAAPARCRSYVTVLDEQAQADLRRRLRARGARARRRPAAPGRAVPQRRPQRRARTRAHAPQHSLREVRRPQVPRSRAREGPARACCAGPTTRATASRRSACCSCCPAWVRRMRSARCDAFEAAAFSWQALAAHPVPPAARETWGPLTRLLAGIGAENAPWEGQVDAVRAVVRTAARAPVRGGACAARRPRPARAPEPAAPHARIVRHRTHARSAAGDAATSRAIRCSTRTTSCCRRCIPRRDRSGSRCTC